MNLEALRVRGFASIDAHDGEDADDPLLAIQEIDLASHADNVALELRNDGGLVAGSDTRWPFDDPQAEKRTGVTRSSDRAVRPVSRGDEERTSAGLFRQKGDERFDVADHWTTSSYSRFCGAAQLRATKTGA